MHPVLAAAARSRLTVSSWAPGGCLIGQPVFCSIHQLTTGRTPRRHRPAAAVPDPRTRSAGPDDPLRVLRPAGPGRRRTRRCEPVGWPAIRHATPAPERTFCEHGPTDAYRFSRHSYSAICTEMSVVAPTGCSLSVTANVRAMRCRPLVGVPADVPDNRPLSIVSQTGPVAGNRRAVTAWVARALAGARRRRPRPQ